MVELCRKLEVHCLTLQHVYGTDSTGLQQESLSNNPELSDSVLSKCRELCESYGIQPRFPPFFDLDRTQIKQVENITSSGSQLLCYAPWRMLRIRWNGDVHPCDLWGNAPPLGNLVGTAFEDIWNGPQYVRLRWDRARRLPTMPRCVSCDMITTDNLEGKHKENPLVLTPLA